MELMVIPMLDQPLPAVTLMWDNPFDDVPPFQFELVVRGRKLSGVPQVTDMNVTLSPEEDTNLVMSVFDHTYNVSDLLFYSEYSFSLVAVYNLTGMVYRSSAVQELNYITEQGGE